MYVTGFLLIAEKSRLKNKDFKLTNLSISVCVQVCDVVWKELLWKHYQLLIYMCSHKQGDVLNTKTEDKYFEDVDSALC